MIDERYGDEIMGRSEMETMMYKFAEDFAEGRDFIKRYNTDKFVRELLRDSPETSEEKKRLWDYYQAESRRLFKKER